MYCKKIGHHHRSLCQKQFGNVEETTTMVNQEESAEAVLSGACIDKEENALVAVGESVIMQTALVEVTNPQDFQTSRHCQRQDLLWIVAVNDHMYQKN